MTKILILSNSTFKKKKITAEIFAQQSVNLSFSLWLWRQLLDEFKVEKEHFLAFAERKVSCFIR